MGESAFKLKELQMRLINLEYNFSDENYNEEKIIDKIERIYLEETGEPLNATIQIKHMVPSGETSEYPSDAKGTAILLNYDNENENADEMLLISRGTVSFEDWIDNTFSIGVGTGGGQYARDTYAFLNTAREEWDVKEVPIYGLGHSKAHNTLTQMQLRTNVFEEVNTYNGAQSNALQQITGDYVFNQAVITEFGLENKDSNAIRSIPPEDLEAFAKDYYKDKGTNIHQDRSKSDFLYALDVMPAMFVVGNVQEHQTDHVNDGFVGAMESIPKEDLQLLGDFLAPYGEVYAEDGFGGVLQVAIQDAVEFYLENPEVEPMDFDAIKSSMGGLVEGLGEAGYLSEEDAQLLKLEVQMLLGSVESIYTRVYEGEGLSLKRGLDDAAYAYLSYNYLLEPRFKNISELLDGIGEAAYEHHSLEALMNEIAVGKSYQGGEMYLETGGGPGGQGQITLNLSQTLEAYAAITSVLDEQDTLLETYLAMMEGNYIDYYENKKKQLGTKMSNIESNYQSYRHLLPTEYSGLITNLKFDEFFKPLVGAPMEGMVMLVKLNRERIETTAEEMRKALEEIFDVEHNVAGMFKHLSG